ncbi:MAG: nitrate reductase cytochrome c-type subunit [Gammaproteobacteria bacterium]|nr:nitrate reductase cytochrome c-type subunit [Gammaproteobacteria bacterium]
MKKPFVMGILLALGVMGGMSQVYAADQVKSLRGASDLDAPSNKVVIKKIQQGREPIERDYVQQPPLIPHKIAGYKINLKVNKCLTCHSWANYKEAGATKISQTHFSDREMSVHANVAARRYFCTQCHVPQADTKPLVENTFQPVETIRR